MEDAKGNKGCCIDRHGEVSASGGSMDTHSATKDALGSTQRISQRQVRRNDLHGVKLPYLCIAKKI